MSKKITVLKAFKVPDPGTDYIRWIYTPPLTSLDVEDLDSVENVAHTYNEGRRQRFGYHYSDRSIEFISDDESDIKEAEEFIREVYELALEDVAEMMGVTKDHLIENLQFYHLRKRRMMP